MTNTSKINDIKTIQDALVKTYPERDANKWISVRNLLNELLDNGKVISNAALAAVALDLLDRNSKTYKKLISRARKLSDRNGIEPGKREVQKLASTAIYLTKNSLTQRELWPHFVRFSFNRNLTNENSEIVEVALQHISDMSKQKTKTYVKKIPELSNLNEEILKTANLKIQNANNDFLKQLNDISNSIKLSLEENDFWSPIENIIISSFDYPFAYELNLITTISKLKFEKNNTIDLMLLPTIPDNLKTTNDIEFPLLATLTNFSKHGSLLDSSLTNLVTPERFSLQVSLEILAKRKSIGI